jgi:S-adenosylmethionine hydrolase
VPGKVEGKIASTSDGGNLITDISVEQLTSAPRGEETVVSCDTHQTMGLFRPDHGQPEMTLLAILADSGVLELAIVGDSAKIMLGVGVGEAVTVKW